MATDEDSLVRKKKDELLALQGKVTDVAGFWTELVKPFGLNDVGLNDLSKLIDKFGVSIILDSMKVAVDKHVVIEDGKPTVDSVNRAWGYVVKVATVKTGDLKNPNLKDIFYIRGILKNRLSYCNEQVARQLIEQAIDAGVDVENLKKMAKNTRNWTSWQLEIRNLLDQ